MGLPAEKRRHTIEEYLRIEQDSSEKHEYWDGELLSMAGGSYEHSLITVNIGGEVRNALKGKPCRVLDSNLRIRIPRRPRYVYPDVSIICGPPQFDPQDPTRQTVLNPRVVVEVLSPSTAAHDRGGKFTSYREIASFEEYVLVAQDQPSVESFFRQPDGTWLFTPYSGREAVAAIRCLGINLPLAEVYAGVEFPTSSEAEAGT